MIETIKHRILIQFDDLDLRPRSQLHEKVYNFHARFLTNFSLDLDEIQCVATTCWFVEAHDELNFRDDIQGTELYLGHFITHSFSICLR